MSTDDKISSATTKVALPDFPGEDVLSHEGLIWKRAAVTKLAPYELVVVAETGYPPALDEIVGGQARARAARFPSPHQDTPRLWAARALLRLTRMLHPALVSRAELSTGRTPLIRDAQVLAFLPGGSAAARSVGALTF